MPLVGSKIEVTTDNFAAMVEENCMLVDKSLFIKKFFLGPKTSLITQFRRSGKSLTLSMLQHFFAAEVDGRPTKDLFNNFAIAKVEDDDGAFLAEYQGKYPVILISFKDIKKESYEDAIAEIKELMAKVYRQHVGLLNNLAINKIYTDKFKKYVSGDISEIELEHGLEFLTEFLYKVHNKRVMVFIDEYDTSLTSAYQHGYLDSMSDFMCNMFSAALKSNSYLEKGLMTGILRISKNNMLSGLNNLEVYTLMDKEYAGYFGFTEPEVCGLLDKFGLEERLEIVREYYNGYKIGDQNIYNPWSIMNYLKKNDLRPYWVLTSNDNVLLKKMLLNSSQEIKLDMRRLIQGESIEGEIEINLHYEQLFEQENALWSLLLACGYLTAKTAELDTMGSYWHCQLKIPNKEVLSLYNNTLMSWLKAQLGTHYYHSFLSSLVEGQVDDFTQRLTKYLFACTSSHDFQVEADYHGFVLGLLASITDTHLLYSNKEFGLGQPDCLLIPKDTSKDQGIILEFKHLHITKKSKKRDVDILKSAAHIQAKEALEQIKIRNYSAGLSQHANITQILNIGIVFANRIVSTAARVCTIINDNNVYSQSPSDDEVLVFDEVDIDTDPHTRPGIYSTTSSRNTLFNDKEEKRKRKIPVTNSSSDDQKAESHVSKRSKLEETEDSDKYASSTFL